MTSPVPAEPLLKLLNTWLRRARIGQHSHHEMGKIFRRRHFALVIPSVIISTALGAAAFTSITTGASKEAKIVFGILSITAAILGAIQLQFRHAERAEKHRNVGSGYGSMRRRIELLLADPPERKSELQRSMEDIRAKLDALGSESEAPPHRIFKKAEKEVDMP